MTNSSIGLAQPGAPGRRWIFIWVWMLIALAYLAFFVIELRLDYMQLLLPCEGAGCNWAAITEAEFAVLAAWGLPARVYADLFTSAIILTVVVYWLLGGLIFWRRGGDRVGFFISMVLIIIPIATFSDADNVAAVYPALLLPSMFLSVIGSNMLILFFYIFPNGELYPRWAIGLLVFSIVVVTVSLLGSNGIYIPINPSFNGYLIAGFFMVLLFAFLVQVLRYINAYSFVERQQTRWVLLGFILFLIGPVLWGALYPGGTQFEPGRQRLLAMSFGWWLINLLQMALPVLLAISILRYRLWNIDLIIRRTLIYGSLTGTLALLYFGTVVTLQGIFSSLTGEVNSPLVTVVSTLVIAALFNPLRLRLQGFIDRRFYRHKYDAEQSVAHFAGSARDEVDMNRLAIALLATVDETVQPEHTSLWIDVPK